MTEERPLIWILDSARSPLADCMDAFHWADAVYIGPDDPMADWGVPPDAIYFSAEIAGGAEGDAFADMRRSASGTPLLAVAKLRSLAQAVAFFRAGAMDYLSLPLCGDHARDRFLAARERRERHAPPTVMVEVESVDGGDGEAAPRLDPAGGADEDILAGLARPGQAADGNTVEMAEPIILETPAARDDERGDPGEGGRRKAEGDEEPVSVDGLPIPSLWEELPCGLLVFDSAGNLVFTNALAMDLFGRTSLAELQETLDAGRASLAAYSPNGKPLPDNQWPQTLAAKSRASRSAVVSIEKPDKRRVWLRIDCLPHLFEGRMTRLSMTIVNLTGELPPLSVAGESGAHSAKRNKLRPRGKRRG